MGDIIHLLPDAVANQIAAGEVVQRPSSAVKELLENTIDAGATDVKVYIREAGKNLIQVSDDGCGMSETDARMCFERHATSKINRADDLLAIRTLGFRGEALASIASVAQVEMKTRRHEDEIGTSIQIEGTEFKGQSPVQCPKGTTFIIKNLFFNVPARRNFLKSNSLEFKYIQEEFFRVALANPSVAFSFYNNDKILHQVPAGNLKQRITNLFGTNYNQRLVPVTQQTGVVAISGFIGKPEFARKTRGEQYFFTNGRYMKSAYLHHAVETAFRELIPDDSFPSYFIYFEVDPTSIDVNIHPTKTEINFIDFKSIYAILHAAVRQSIGQFSLTPTIDFNVEQSLNIPPPDPNRPPKQPVIQANPNYNPFNRREEHPLSQPSRPTTNHSGFGSKWQEFYAPVNRPDSLPFFPSEPTDQESSRKMHPETGFPAEMKSIQIRDSFIVTSTRSAIVILDQQHAHERILYEKYLDRSKDEFAPGQLQLIPQTLNLGPGDAELLKDWISHFKNLGFEIGEFGKDTFLVRSAPAGINPAETTGLLESILESLKSEVPDSPGNHEQLLAKAMARKMAVKRGQKLHQEECDAIVGNLFACKVPEISPEGKPTMMQLPFDDLGKKMKI